MSYIKKLAGQTAIYGVSTILGRLLNYLLVPLHTYIFATSEYGIVGNMYAYITFLNVVYLLGMETGFFHFSQKWEDRTRVFSAAFTLLFITSVLFSGTILLNEQAIADWLDYSEHSEYIRWTALILAFDTLAAIPFSSLRLREKAKKFATVKIANILINVFLNVFFLLGCPYVLNKAYLSFLHPFINAVYDPAIGVGYVFIANLVASALTLVFLYRELLMFRLRISVSMMKSMVRYASPLVVLGLAGMVNETIDRILLKDLLPYSTKENLSQLGIYNACYKLSIFMTLVVQAFRYAAEPFFFSQATEANDPKNIYADVMKYFVFLGGVIFLGVNFYIDILKYLIGSDYHEGLKVVPILLMANWALGIFYNLSIWYKLQEKTHLGALISITGALITIGLNFWLIPVLGYMGSAWATLASYGTMVTLSYVLSRKYYPIPYNLGRNFFYIGLAIIFFFGGKYFQESIAEGWNLLSASMNTFLLALYILVFLTREKANFLLNLLGRLFNK